MIANQASETSAKLNDLVLGKTNGKISLEIKLDKKNEHLLDLPWYLDKDGYAITRTGKRMHRLVINAQKGEIVDHINHNILDNQEENLRIVSSQQNAQHRKKQCGVFKRKENGKWQAQIMVNYKNIKLGCFHTYEEALEVRLNAERFYDFSF